MYIYTASCDTVSNVHGSTTDEKGDTTVLLMYSIWSDEFPYIQWKFC
jgi:hypothetical protein